jgi:threonine/homoserine/homoserine lactone efflux protein
MPVGPITILIVDMSLRRGFAFGLAAGAGTAVVDFLFAALAVLAGEALSLKLTPYAIGLRVASALVLLGWGAYGFWRARKIAPWGSKSVAPQHYLGVFVQFLGLTAINPITILYFSALILGRGVSDAFTIGEKASFILGAGLASFSWQTLLAAFGATLHRNLSRRFQLVASLLGNSVVIGWGIYILLNLAS